MSVYNTESFDNFQNKAGVSDGISPRQNLQNLLPKFHWENIKTEIKNYCPPKSAIRLNSGKEIIGAGTAMRDVSALLSQVAFYDSTVLLCGETGTGKELFAQAVHDASARREKPIIEVNCAALPANLIES